MTYKSRRRWSLFILVIGLPVYIVLAVTVMSNTTHWPRLVQLPIYVILGVGWVFPLKFIFTGIGQANPDPTENEPRLNKALIAGFVIIGCMIVVRLIWAE